MKRRNFLGGLLAAAALPSVSRRPKELTTMTVSGLEMIVKAEIALWDWHTGRECSYPGYKRQPATVRIWRGERKFDGMDDILLDLHSRVEFEPPPAPIYVNAGAIVTGVLFKGHETIFAFPNFPVWLTGRLWMEPSV